MRQQMRVTLSAGKIPVLRWAPPSPAGGADKPLDDFEWSELQTPGTALAKAWAGQVAELIQSISLLSKDGNAILISALPESNSSAHWWSGRPGPHGSQYLLDTVVRSVQAAGAHKVLWAWQPLLGSPGDNTHADPLPAFAPGPGFMDVLLIDAAHPEVIRGYGANVLSDLAGTRPILSVQQ